MSHSFSGGYLGCAVQHESDQGIHNLILKMASANENNTRKNGEVSSLICGQLFIDLVAIFHGTAINISS